MRAAGVTSDPTITTVDYTMKSAREKCQLSNLLLSAILVPPSPLHNLRTPWFYRRKATGFGFEPTALQLPSQISESADSTPPLPWQIQNI